MDRYALGVRSRQAVPILVLGALVAAGGCSGPEPRFDLVPGPASVGLLWLEGADGPCSLTAEQWACIDEVASKYRRDFADLIRREATPLVRDFHPIRDESWRRDAPLMERLIARQSSLLRGIEVLDDGFFAGLEACGVDGGWVDRMRVERQIERCRFVIEGIGPSIIDLRDFLPERSKRSSELASVMDRYAVSLAALLPGLRDAERARPLRIRRILDRLESAGAAAPSGEAPTEEQRQQWEQEADEAAAAPVRRELGRLLDLNLATIEQLRSAAPAETFDALLRDFRNATDSAVGGAGISPVIEWQVEVALASPAMSETHRTTLAQRLERFRERDRSLADGLLQAMRRGEPIPCDRQERGARDALRTELLGAALGMLPQAQREQLVQLGNVTGPDLENLVRELAPGKAAWLLERMPASLRAPPEDDELPGTPSKMAYILLPRSVDEAFLNLTLDRFDLDADQRTVAEQLWRDDAAAALRALDPIGVAAKHAESALGPSLADPGAFGRALDAYFAVLERARGVIAAAEERYLDSLAALVDESDRPLIDRLRWERRLARAQLNWRFMFFGDGMGFTAECGVTAVETLARAEIEPHDRAIAESLLDARLPDLVAEAEAFRGEALAALRRVGVSIARLPDKGQITVELPAILSAAASSVRPSVDRHIGLHQAALQEIADALPQTTLALRRSWRRLAYPEYFTHDRELERAINLSIRRAGGDEAVATRIRLRADQYDRELDDAEEVVMAARRAATVDGPPTDRREVRIRLRQWPELAAAVAFRREVQLRLLRDLACVTTDPALHAMIDAWARREPPRSYWLYE